MEAIYGKKVGMTRIFTETGEVVPVTVLELGPNVVHQVKTVESDGYSALQIGFGAQKSQRADRPSVGHLSKAKKGIPQFIGEIRLDYYGGKEKKEFQVGDTLSLEDMFAIDSHVDVMGTTIGKGYAGVMKRHHMAGFPAGHGTHEYFRHGGSIGNRKFPGRVFKNKRMSGHMGCEQQVQPNLRVVAVRKEENLLLVEGSVPGAKNGYVFVRKAVKQ